MTRDKSRELFSKSGLTYEKIGVKEIASLRELISKYLDKFDNKGFTMKLTKERPFKYSKNGGIVQGSFRVCGSHFDNREAITFNTDGFIGFAGWSDASNVVPFLDGFNEWINSLIQ